MVHPTSQTPPLGGIHWARFVSFRLQETTYHSTSDGHCTKCEFPVKTERIYLIHGLKGMSGEQTAWDGNGGDKNNTHMFGMTWDKDNVGLKAIFRGLNQCFIFCSTQKGGTTFD